MNIHNSEFPSLTSTEAIMAPIITEFPEVGYPEGKYQQGSQKSIS